MPNVTRGNRVGGLMTYLVSVDPDKTRNVHTEPHLVAGSDPIMAWFSDGELSHEQGLAVGRQLNAPRRAFQVDVPGGHVWHCSLSLPADEGRLPDERWAAIAHRFVAEMGFEEEGRAPCRWVAVHHGQSKAGNDHIHLVVSLVREDGTKANVWRDRPRAQAAARLLEQEFGLQVLESRGAGRGGRGVARPVLERAERSGAVEPETVTLARLVRGAGAAAVSEAEFVRRLRASGVSARPRMASGRGDVVVGYSVRLGGEGVWYGGGHLARDLTLPRLREAGGWNATPGEASEAVAAWTSAQRQPVAVAPVSSAAAPAEVPAAVVPDAAWEAAAAEVGALREWLRTVPVSDRATWARAAGEAAGVLAAWSAAVEGGFPGPLASAADSLARSAQVRAHAARGARRGPSARGAALLCASVGHAGRGTVGQAVLLRQLSNTARALHDAHLAAGEARRAAEIAGVARSELVAVAAALPAPEQRAPAVAAPAVARAVPSPARTPGSVLPADLERARRMTGPREGRGRDR